MILDGSVFAFKKILRSQKATKEFVLECRRKGCRFSFDNGMTIDLDKLSHEEMQVIAQKIWDTAIERENPQ